MARPHIVIVGAGFGGLERRRRARRRRCRRHRHRPAQLPSLPAAALPGRHRRPVAGADRLADPRHPAPRGQRPGAAGQGERHRQGAPHRRARGSHASSYDYLVLATGARHSYFGHDEWESVAPGLKKIDDATGIRRRILTAFENAEAADEPRGAPPLAHLRRDRRRPDRRGDGRRHRRAGARGAAPRLPQHRSARGAHRAGRGGPAPAAGLSGGAERGRAARRSRGWASRSVSARRSRTATPRA